MEIWTEYEAVKAVESMSLIEVLKFVDKRVACTKEHTAAEYRKMAVELMKKELA